MLRFLSALMMLVLLVGQAVCSFDRCDGSGTKGSSANSLLALYDQDSAPSGNTNEVPTPCYIFSFHQCPKVSEPPLLEPILAIANEHGLGVQSSLNSIEIPFKLPRPPRAA